MLIKKSLNKNLGTSDAVSFQILLCCVFFLVIYDSYT